MSHSNYIKDVITIKFDKFRDDKIIKSKFLGEDAFVLYNVFSKDECNRIISGAEKIGFDKLEGYDLKYRNNLRLVTESPKILDEFERRINPYIQKSVHIDENTTTIHKHRALYGEWEYSAINTHLRICKYNPNNHFSKHYDSGYHPDPTSNRTIKTCMLYLNSEFEGGCTRFFNEKKLSSGEDELFFSLKPEAGMCVIFNQNILHDGELVTTGLKYMMRTDIFYKARILKNKLTDKQKEALDIYSQADELEDNDKMSEALAMYKKAWALEPDIDLLYH